MNSFNYLDLDYQREGASEQVGNVEDRGIVIPEFSERFSEFMGALAGDGHLTDSNYTYRVEFTLDRTEDKYYVEFLERLIEDLFHIEPRIYRRENAGRRVDVQFHSKKIHSFISGVFPKGKKENLTVPRWVKGEDRKSAFLRGLMDTDGSLFFAKRGMYENNSYPVMELKMEEETFLDEIETMLQDFDIGTYRSAGNKIQLNGENKLEKWVNEIGFSNPSRSSRYYVWKIQNYCPPNTSLQERLEILKNKPG